MGGRNIADEYFGLSDKYDFRDIDLLAVGTVVGEAEGAFDAYWNNRWAFPITSLDHHARDLASMIANIYRAIDDTYRNFPYRTELPPDQIMRRLGEREHELVWAPAELVFDPPDKIAGIKHHQPTAAAAHGYELAADAQHEIVAEAAYFVPGDLTRIRELRRRGVTVRLLTNSLASTDLIPVHAAYRKTRRRVVELGVELREVNTWAPSRAIYIAQLGPKTTLSLHAKVSVIDRSTVYLGSVNLDPRSTYLNTEVAVAIHSPELAERVLAALSRDFEDINSWRVVIDDDGAVRWHGARSGRTRCRTAEPDATLGRRFKASIFALLPIRSLL
jgi:putative cardiolipin synthase